MRYLRFTLPFVLAISMIATPARLQAQAASLPNEDIFRRDNLMAWCIVPFDAKKRGPEERAAMLAKLGFKHFAYDYRGEHVPTFDAEIEALKKHGVSLDAWWFPGSLNNEAKHILAVCKKHGVTPQLWVTGGGAATKTPEEQAARVKQEAARIRPIAEAAAAQGMKVGLYNHGGWFGEPENQLAIIAELKLPNVGIVYNQHHGHGQVDRFAEFLPKIIPHLLVLNLNGMNPAGDQRGQKIMQLGQGDLDLKLLKIIRAGDYRGPIGILGHTQDDAEARLADNLDGLAWLLPQLDGKPAGAKPKMRTPVPGAHDPAKPQANGGAGGGGYVATGKVEYRTLPLSVELRATLKGKGSYNILVANDTKRSAEHWELFTMPGTGTLAVYVPGRSPDHIHTKVDICDGKPHEIAFVYESDRGRLFVDGAPAGDQKLAIKPRGGDVAPEKLAFLRLVEGGMGCDGTLDYVRISRGVREVVAKPSAELKADDATVGLWRFAADGKTDAADTSKLANPAVRQSQTAAAPSKSPIPAPGVHLMPVDPALKVTLIDRSPDEVYMGVKADKDGNVFVGGREGVFVFERDAKASFKPRRELLRFPKHSIIMGLEFKDDDLFVLTCNALYRVPGGRVKRDGLVPERLLWGIPLDLHVSFHCLAWGPEGDLYVTHGDPLLNYGDWTRPDHWGHWVYYSRGQGSEVGGQKENSGQLSVASGQLKTEKDEMWRKTPYTGQGAVLRYSLKDGAVNVVATGLRGPVGLAFDDHWNLFTNDNDHESRADQYAPAKLLHVVEGIDFGWPRGWMASKSPERFDLVEPVCDLGRGVPCDLAFYDRDYLPESVQGRLLHARWDRYSVTGYKMQPRGMSFTAKEETILQGDDNCRPVGIAVGLGGELFVTALYMTGNMAAPYCASDLVMVTRADGEAPNGTKPLHDLPNPLTFAQVCEYAKVQLNEMGPDTYAIQFAVRSAVEIQHLSPAALQTAQSEARRLGLVLMSGRKLTVPRHDETPPESLPLNYPKGNGWFHRDQVFYGSDKIVDLADFARIGSYMMAERWKAVPHSEEQEKLFELLMKALDDPSERVKLQAAYFLGLLRDPRSEPKIEAVRRSIAIAKLKAAPTVQVREAWCMGPFASQLQQKASTATDAAPESGSIDLTTKYRNQAWEKRGADRVLLRAGSADPDAEAPWLYVYFSVQSRVKQSGLVSVAADLERRLWVNGREVVSGDGTDRREGEIVELQPGGNELLLKFQVTSQQAGRGFDTDIRIQATDPIQMTLADRFDSSLLAARLRDAVAAGGAQPIAKEFLSVDWTKETTLGDAAAGRKLFGTLACTKCHAITADQKSAGAPSLLGAKLRFTVPHLVESVLLPSRQVAEPFRAQTFTTTAGQTFTGLVVGETAEMVELVLPDATRKTLAVKEIEERMPTTMSPMPQGLVKTPQELRDLLAYLLSEKPTPP
jgi:putative heme-binding domain-containing protein